MGAKDYAKTFIRYIIADKWEILSYSVYLVVVIILALIFKVFDVGLQAYRAFDYTDTSLSYEHRPSVVSGNLNIVISTLYGIVLSFIGNAVTRICSKREVIQLREASKLNCKGCVVEKEHKIRIYKLIWGIIFLLIAIVETNLLTNFTKTAMGVLKPHFITECNPDTSNLVDTTWVDEHETLTICQNKDRNIRRSFPSGHASQAAVGIAYGCLEINNLHVFNAASRSLQMGGALYAVYIWTIRITNNQHHWADVLFGALLGICVAVSAYLLKEKQVTRQYRINSEQPLQNYFHLQRRYSDGSLTSRFLLKQPLMPRNIAEENL